MRVEPRHVTLLQRLDLGLAVHAAERAGAPESWQPPWLSAAPAMDGPRIARLLGLRGLLVDPADACAVLEGRSCRYELDHQELRMVKGLATALAALRTRASRGEAPNGWFAVDVFRRMTIDVPRFRNNAVRRDVPWDAVFSVPYPPAAELHGMLDEFAEDNAFGDASQVFHNLHPVRQSVRVFWRFARMSPFPDFNVVMAFLMMNAHLLAKGYPMLEPRWDDRSLLLRIIAGRPPMRVVQFESRLAEVVARC